MRPVDQQAFEDFQAVIREEIPGFKVGYKDQSSLMKFLGFLARPFNPKFLTNYITTWGNTVYFPSTEFVMKEPGNALCVLAHEFVHLCDYRDHGFWGFQVTYAAPQIYALIPMLAYAILGSVVPLLIFFGCYLAGAALAKWKWLMWSVFGIGVLAALVTGWLLSGFWLFLLVGSLVPLAMSSSSRTKWELRGYTMTLATFRWMFERNPPPAFFDFIRTQFTGPDYFFMCRNDAKIDTALSIAYEKIKDESIRDEKVYDLVYNFFV